MTDDDLDLRVGAALTALADDLLNPRGRTGLPTPDDGTRSPGDRQPALPDVDGFSANVSSRQRALRRTRLAAASVLVLATLAATAAVVANRHHDVGDEPAPAGTHLLPTVVPDGFKLEWRSTAPSSVQSSPSAPTTRQAWNTAERKSLTASLTEPDPSPSEVFAEQVQVRGHPAVLTTPPASTLSVSVRWHDGNERDLLVSFIGVGRTEALALAGVVSAPDATDRIDFDLPAGWVSSSMLRVATEESPSVSYRRGTDGPTILLMIGVNRASTESMAHAGFFATEIETPDGPTLAGERDGASSAVATLGDRTIVAQAFGAASLRPGAEAPVTAAELGRMVRSVRPVRDSVWETIPTLDQVVAGRPTDPPTSAPGAFVALHSADGTATMTEAPAADGTISLSLERAGSRAAGGLSGRDDHVGLTLGSPTEATLGGRTPAETASVIAELADGTTVAAVVGPSKYVGDHLWLLVAPTPLRAVVARDGLGNVLWREGVPAS